MKKPTNKQIKDSGSEELKTLADERDVFKDMEILASSKGGQILVSNLLKDIIATMETLGNKYTELSHTEFIAYSAGIKEKMDLIRVLTRAEKNREFLDEELAKEFESILTN